MPHASGRPPGSSLNRGGGGGKAVVRGGAGGDRKAAVAAGLLAVDERRRRASVGVHQGAGPMGSRGAGASFFAGGQTLPPPAEGLRSANVGSGGAGGGVLELMRSQASAVGLTLAGQVGERACVDPDLFTWSDP